MPTLSKAKLAESESPWLETWDEMYPYLCLNKGPILTAIGFYAEHDLQTPDANQAGDLTKDEEAELRRIATALTHAAAASEAMPIGVLVASLKKVSKNPSLHYSGQLPEAIEWSIACHYRRSEEKPATHWRDVWGNQSGLVGGEVEVPTELNIARAAISAIHRIQNGRRRGRPYNRANQILADGLGEIFRSNGQRISRRLQPDMRHSRLVFVESGPFYDFLKLVLPLLQQYLRERGLAPVTMETIVRLVAEDFPSPR